jgi:hypothetical protein
VLPKLKQYLTTLNQYQGKVVLFIDEVMERLGTSFQDTCGLIRRLGMQINVISNGVVEVVVAGA